MGIGNKSLIGLCLIAFIHICLLTPPSAGEITATSDAKFAKGLIRKINKIRKQYGAKPLKGNSLLKTMAENKVMNQVTIYPEVEYPESTPNDCGMGEWLWQGTFQDPKDFLNFAVLDDLKSQAERHDFTLNELQEGTAVFSNVVWKSTKYIGCHAVKMEEGGEIIQWAPYCYVYPGGNVDGQFLENVCANAGCTT